MAWRDSVHLQWVNLHRCRQCRVWKNWPFLHRHLHYLRWHWRRRWRPILPFKSLQNCFRNYVPGLVILDGHRRYDNWLNMCPVSCALYPWIRSNICGMVRCWDGNAGRVVITLLSWTMMQWLWWTFLNRDTFIISTKAVCSSCWTVIYIKWGWPHQLLLQLLFLHTPCRRHRDRLQIITIPDRITWFTLNRSWND